MMNNAIETKCKEYLLFTASTASIFSLSSPQANVHCNLSGEFPFLFKFEALPEDENIIFIKNY